MRAITGLRPQMARRSRGRAGSKAGRERGMAVRSGLVPPLADGFIARPASSGLPGLAAALVPGAAQAAGTCPGRREHAGLGGVVRQNPARGHPSARFPADRRRLYMTATPRIGTGISVGGKLLVTSMDDEQVFGPVAYTYPFSRGIAEGWLKGYRLVVAGITDAQVSELLDGEDGGRLVAEGAERAEIEQASAVLRKAQSQVDERCCS